MINRLYSGISVGLHCTVSLNKIVVFHCNRPICGDNRRFVYFQQGRINKCGGPVLKKIVGPTHCKN